MLLPIILLYKFLKILLLVTNFFKIKIQFIQHQYSKNALNHFLFSIFLLYL